MVRASDSAAGIVRYRYLPGGEWLRQPLISCGLLVCLFACLFVCLSVCLLVCLFVCLFVCCSLNGNSKYHETSMLVYVFPWQ